MWKRLLATFASPICGASRRRIDLMSRLPLPPRSFELEAVELRSPDSRGRLSPHKLLLLEAIAVG